MSTCPIQVSGDIVSLRNRITTAPIIVIDTETTGVDYNCASLVGAAFYVPGDDTGYYLPTFSVVDPMQFLVPLPDLIQLIQSIAIDPQHLVVMHHAQYDMLILRRYGVTFAASVYDTYYAEHRLDNTYKHVYWQGQQLNYKLKTLTKRFLGHDQTTFREATQGLPAQMVTISRMAPYAVGDVYYTAQHFLRQQRRLKARANGRIGNVLTSYDFATFPAIVEMMYGGVDINQQIAHEEIAKARDHFDATEEHIARLLGKAPSLSKANILRSILNELGFPVHPWTSLREQSLSMLAGKIGATRNPHEIKCRQFIRLVVLRRNLANTIGKFLVPLLGRTDTATGKLHIGGFHSVQETARYAATKPNIQALPKAKYSPVRRVIAASPGYTIVAADFKNIEPRCLAQALILFLKDRGGRLDEVKAANRQRAWKLFPQIMKERKFLKEYEDAPPLPYPTKSLLAEFFLDPASSGDPYTFIAGCVFNNPRPTDDERSSIKTLYLGIVYGRGINSIAYELKKNHNDTALLMNKFADVMPELGVPTYEPGRHGKMKVAAPTFRTFKDEVGQILRLSGEVESLFGRRRRFPGLYHLRRCTRCRVYTERLGGRELEWTVAPLQLWNFSLHSYVYQVRDVKTGNVLATDTHRKQLAFLYKHGLCAWPIKQISYKFTRRIEVGNDIVHFQPIDDCQRQGFNAVIQMTAGDVLRQAILNTQPILTTYGARMLFNVHDESVFTVPTAVLHPFIADMRAAMTAPPAPWWKIPIDVDVEVGPNYGQLTTYVPPASPVVTP